MIQNKLNGLRPIHWSVIIPLFFLILVAPARAATGLERVITDHSTYEPGEAIKVAFTNGPANAKDWIGIYKEGQIPGTTGVSSTKYLYVDGTAGGATGKSQGEVTFSGTPLAPGNWVAYLLLNDGYRVLAQDKFTVLEATAPEVRTDKQVYAKNEKITVSFKRGPGNARDWIGIYAEGVTPGPGSTAYKYVDNTTTGNVGLTDGTVTFDNGLPMPGRWVAYLLENDDYVVLAQDSFEIALSGSGVVTITPNHQHYLPGQPVRIAFEGGPGNNTDWIGVYRAGQRPGGPGATDWRYVGGTQTAGAGLTGGEIVLDRGFAGPQQWVAYFMLSDLYNIAGNTGFEVLDATAPIVQVSKRVYNLGEPISIAFTNAPSNAKDWIGIFRKGVNPASATATLWNYTDGTRTGTDGITEGVLDFAAGLNSQDEWTAYLFENDGYNVLSKEDFTVRASGVLPARLAAISPSDAGLAGPTADLRAILENRDTTVNLNSINVKFDGADIPFTKTVEGNLITLATQGSQIFAVDSPHTYTVSFTDSANATTTRTINFKIGPYVNMTLPAPLFLESFESTAEGGVPVGWTVSNSSDPVDITPDLQHLGSSAYNDFVVVDSERLRGNFLTYATGTPETAPIAQILGPSAVPTVLNGSLVRSYANGHILFGLSGYHGGANQILEAVTPDYNLSGKQNIYLSFHSLLEQNQDSVEGIEVSNDGGATWHPVVYYLDPPDIIKTNNVVDADQTFNTVYTAGQRLASFPDGSGGTVGSFLKAPADAEAAAHIAPRLDNVPQDGTRVELFRIPEADNQPAVRFRIFLAGTDSWYFGLDDFGLYSISATVEPRLSINRNGSTITISWPAGTGLVLQSSSSLAPGSWQNVTGVVGNSFTPTATDAYQFYRLFSPTP